MENNSLIITHVLTIKLKNKYRGVLEQHQTDTSELKLGILWRPLFYLPNIKDHLQKLLSCSVALRILHFQ